MTQRHKQYLTQGDFFFFGKISIPALSFGAKNSAGRYRDRDIAGIAFMLEPVSTAVFAHNCILGILRPAILADFHRGVNSP